MGKVRDFVTNSHNAPVILLAVTDFLFLIVLVYVFKTDTATELRTVIKDAFIGWNGSLAIAINIAHREPDSSPGGSNQDGNTVSKD